MRLLLFLLNCILNFFPSWASENHLFLGNKINLSWNSEDSQWITFELRTKASGYVGIGFSPTGGMGGSDIILGWIYPNGTAVLKDYFATGNQAPELDMSQDVELLGANRGDAEMILKFRRKWDTCDERDMKLADDTIRIIWAWSDTDPTSLKDLQWHGPENRGAKSVFLKSNEKIPFPDQSRSDPSIKYWDVRFNNFKVPDTDTTYHCKIVKFPTRRKAHILGYRPLTSPEENRFNLHHQTLYLCRIPKNLTHLFEKYSEDSGGFDCYKGGFAPLMNTYCFTFTVVSTLGSEGSMFPEYVGLPIGSLDGENDTYLKFENHYDNPTRRKIVDSSGLRIFYTQKLRKYDAGLLFLGTRNTPFQVIPPGQKAFKTTSFCASECTKAGFPGGVKFTSVLLHAHQAGKALRVRHIRGGQELPIIMNDDYYDVNYQQFRELSPEVDILPGDEFIIECEYNTEGKKTYLEGGFSSSKREMCQALVLYYPAESGSMVECRSQVEFNSYFKPFGIDEVTGNALSYLKMPYNPEKFTPEDWKTISPDDSALLDMVNEVYKEKRSYWADIWVLDEKNRNVTMESILQEVNWKDKELSKKIETQWGNTTNYMFCLASGSRRLNKEVIVPFPKYKPKDSILQCLPSNSAHLKSSKLINFILIATMYSSMI